MPLTDEDAAHGHALALVLGVAVSTYLSHVFSEIVGLRSEKPSFRTLLVGLALTAVAAAISLLKAVLGH